ncbi:hypothetical protein [Rothia sp. ZJ932]|uniref:hypothetical protein n=1 Tax=Rothia sp. ZJ932 TaxID=2810516 RepID=UPI00196716C4|nr:hypothetical protein [Rothia sp. ZJ932]QRZ62145.1 hypothetical protein JR346_03240 [Rothia sp. ZJ932]
MTSVVGASSLLVIIAGVIIWFSQSRFKTPLFEAINAEKFASDVIDGQEENPSHPLVADENPAQSFILKKGRTAIFVAAAICLLLALLTALATPFTAVSWWVPLLLGGFSFTGLATLRALAVADMKKKSVSFAERGDARPRSMNLTVAEAVAHEENPVEMAAPYETERVYRPAAVASAAKNLRRARTHRPVEHRRVDAAAVEPEVLGPNDAPARYEAHRSFEVPAANTWTPVEVPVPTYLEAEVVYAERTVEPLQAPAPVHAESKTVVEAAARGSKSIDLDQVLNRRRA